MHNIPISIAGVLIEVQSPLSAAELGIEERLGPFFGRPDAAEAKVALRWEASDGRPSAHGDLLYDPGSIWRMYRQGQEYYAAIGYQTESAEDSTHAVLMANSSWDDLTLTEWRSSAAWQSLLNFGAGELLLRTRVLFAGGLVFHASGIDDNGRGIVFVGHSGAGKSTQAGLWSTIPGVVAMNDDRIAVRQDGGKVTAYGTPWGGDRDIRRNHHAPLSAIIVLEQASENEILPLLPAAAAPLLLARTFLPYWDAALLRRAVTNLDGILERVPVYRLRCRPELAVIPLVRSVL